ncbi:MAG: SDR family NAD(P)-dependent oxidoreductase [Fusobacterium sp. JB021]|nr:SDR family NAD(P)-dependent oxidoreductase [Fusobacterium sp. JB020]MDP0494092.1 SDR family NAD(P)-dependent oxidoreductase [Fusobacterium sp. JB021]
MNVIITGVTRGIGYNIALEFIKRGDKVIGISRTGKELEKIRENFPLNFIPIKSDITNEEEIDNIYKKLKDMKISPDILVNNAGVGYISNFCDLSWEKNKRMISLNIIALTYMTHKFLEEIENNDGAKGIINVSSTGACQSGGPLFATYYASKSYVKSFSNGISEELRDKNIRVMCLLPGPTKTTFNGMEKAEGFYIMNASKVAKIAVKDFFKGKEISIPGLTNKFLVAIGNIIPRSLELKILKNIQNKK